MQDKDLKENCMLSLVIVWPKRESQSDILVCNVETIGANHFRFKTKQRKKFLKAKKKTKFQSDATVAVNWEVYHFLAKATNLTAISQFLDHAGIYWLVSYPYLFQVPRTIHGHEQYPGDLKTRRAKDQCSNFPLVLRQSMSALDWIPHSH